MRSVKEPVPMLYADLQYVFQKIRKSRREHVYQIYKSFWFLVGMAKSHNGNHPCSLHINHCRYNWILQRQGLFSFNLYDSTKFPNLDHEYSARSWCYDTGCLGLSCFAQIWIGKPFCCLVINSVFTKLEWQERQASLYRRA